MFRKMMAWIVAGTMMAGCLPVATASADGQPIDLRGRELGSLSSETGRIEVPQFNIVELKSGSMPADLRFSCSNPAFDIDMSKAGFMYDTNMNIKISGSEIHFENKTEPDKIRFVSVSGMAFVRVSEPRDGSEINLKLACENPSFETALKVGTFNSKLNGVNHKITIAPSSEGTVIPDRTSAAAGDMITLKFQPADGYKLLHAEYNQEYITPIIDNEARFMMPAADVLVNARFERIIITEDTSDGFKFETASGTITGYHGSEKNLVIPTAISGVPVKKLGENLFVMTGGIESITVPDGVTEIGKFCFAECPDLKKIVLPSGITAILERAFSGCGSLREITIPQSVTKIGESAFSSCTSLTKIVIPKNVTDISDSAFWGANSLKDIKFEGDAPRIGANSFITATKEDPRTVHLYQGSKGFYVPAFSSYNRVIWNPSAEKSAASAGIQDSVGIRFNGIYMTGYADGLFHPSDSLTRGQLAVMLGRILGLDISDTGSAIYSDVTSAHWAFASVQAVSKAGIMGAFSTNTFKSEDAATRADVALAIAAALKYRNCIPEAKASPFTDVEGNPAQSAILTVYSAGIISGFEDGTFRPGTITNREQAVSMLNKLMQRPVLIPATATFEDVPDSRWSFGAIESATHNQVVNPFN